MPTAEPGRNATPTRWWRSSRRTPVYAESTWAPPAVGHAGVRGYWEDATGSQRDVAFGYEIVTADPPVVRWWASYARPDQQARGELDGVFLLDFAADDRCSRLREWWFWREAPSTEH